MKAAFLAAAVLATAGVAFYFGTAVGTAKSGGFKPAAQQALASKPLSLPMFFEPNQGQTDPRVKFLARGSGYGLFLTADEAVLELQKPVPAQRTATPMPRPTSSWIRMKLEGANASARVSGVSPLPGKSNYFIGNDRSKWRAGIPQFARVEYQAVYPGVDLVYYGNQGQLEYDFRVAPGAEPGQIALSFAGASARVDADSADLILSTANGDIRFHAPHVYQPAAPASGNSPGYAEKTVAGSFRQLADNKIGFTIGDYDHRRELVIDPVLSYSTYLGAGGESLVKVAVNSAGYIYVAGSTTSAYFFPIPTNGLNPPPPLQTALGGSGAQNLFIAEINPFPQAGYPQLLYATYLGGSGTDSLAGIAVDSALNVYVAGTTTSTDFPTSTGNNGTLAPFQATPLEPGTHGFLSVITFNTTPVNTDTLYYSTYLSGNGSDTVTGLAIDNSCNPTCNAYVTGVTTSSNPATQLNPFPASPGGFQTVSESPGNAQFFASKIDTAQSGLSSLAYSTYFGGGNFGTTDIAIGGGIAVDLSSSNVNMYFTGTTNQLGVQGADGSAAFPLYNAQQSCLNEASKTSCGTENPTTTTDAFVAKIDPNVESAVPVYSTYLGGMNSDYGYGIAVDSSSNAYVVGATSSPDWVIPGSGFQTSYQGSNGASNGFIAKIGNNTNGSVYVLNYFTYLGGTGPDSIQDIKVDSNGGAHVVGTTSSAAAPPFPITVNDNVQATYGGGNSDAFVALILTASSGTFPLSTPAGDYSTYLGGSGTDQGTGIALDLYGNAYVAGVTQSPESTTVQFPSTPNAYQSTLVGTQDAFVSKIGASSILVLSIPNTSPNPYPTVAAGTQVAFTFDITNTGTDNASLVQFDVLGLPTSGLTGQPTAKITSNTGSCGAVQGAVISCNIPNLVVNAVAAVEVDMTPSSPVLNSLISVSGNIVSANGAAVSVSMPQPSVSIVDFNVNAKALTPTVNAGDTAQIQAVFCPTSQAGYNATITPSQTTNPSMVTATTPTFNPTSIALEGTACGTTTLSIATVARPVSSLVRRGPFYAVWLPIGGLSLVGLGLGAGRKRRRWLIGAVLVLIAGIILLQPGCGSASSSTPTSTGTAANNYGITIVGSAGTGASHSTLVYVTVK